MNAPTHGKSFEAKTPKLISADRVADVALAWCQVVKRTVNKLHGSEHAQSCFNDEVIGTHQGHKIRNCPSPIFPSKFRAALLTALTLTVVACGGGGGGDTDTDTASMTPPSTSTPLVPEVSDVIPSCEGCGAINNSTYSGAGVGIWHHQNTGMVTKDVAVSIAGLVNKTVTLIFTNETSSSQVLAANQPHSEFITSPTTSNTVSVTGGSELTTIFPVLSVVPSSSGMIGRERKFAVKDGSARATTLKNQLVTSDGTVVNVWVETAELGAAKLTTGHIDHVATTFAGMGGVYDMLKDAGGALWGPHSANYLMSGENIAIDIVMVNLSRNGAAYGEVGYFFGGNSYKRTTYEASNESLALFIDTETLYLGGARGVETITGILAHEGQHMSNFYQREVLMGFTHRFSPWLEEMSAMMMEDAVTSMLSKTHNSVRDGRFAPYLQDGAYACPLLEFGGFGKCDGYALHGTFGGFLLRQLGMPFLKILLKQTGADSEAVLQAAIKAVRPESSIGDELRRFAVATIAVLPASQAPVGFSFPSRVDGAVSLVGIDAQTFKSSRLLSQAATTTFYAYSSAPVIRAGVSGTFRQTVQLPAGSSLSVAVTD